MLKGAGSGGPPLAEPHESDLSGTLCVKVVQGLLATFHISRVITGCRVITVLGKLYRLYWYGTCIKYYCWHAEVFKQSLGLACL